jgi:predicted transcriptional regulator
MVRTLVTRFGTEGTAAFRAALTAPPQTRARAQTIAAHGDIMKVTVRQGVQDVDRGKVYAAGVSAVFPLRLA